MPNTEKYFVIFRIFKLFFVVSAIVYTKHIITMISKNNDPRTAVRCTVSTPYTSGKYTSGAVLFKRSENKCECGALSELTLNPDCSVVFLTDVLGYGESETRSFLIFKEA